MPKSQQSNNKIFQDIYQIDSLIASECLCSNSEKIPVTGQFLENNQRQDLLSSFYLIDLSEEELSSQMNRNPFKRKMSPLRREISQSIEDQIDNLLILDEPQQDLQNQEEIPERNNFNHKKENSRLEKSKTYAKNYRQRKKSEIKCLQEENRFLKQKIEDLSFRLKETQVELNKLRHSTQTPSTQIFNEAKQSYFKEIEKVLNQESENLDMEKLLQIQENVRNLNKFSSKHKMGILNYFMSELLQNLVNDISFYFIDSVLQKRGFWRVNEKTPYRKMDQEILSFYSNEDLDKFKIEMSGYQDHMLQLMNNFKGLWKKLYHDYLEIIKHGSLIQTICEPMVEKLRKQNARKEVLNALKLELYFQKIKYRKDMRMLRETWFQEFQKEEVMKNSDKINKKTKVGFY